MQSRTAIDLPANIAQCSLNLLRRLVSNFIFCCVRIVSEKSEIFASNADDRLDHGLERRCRDEFSTKFSFFDLKRICTDRSTHTLFFQKFQCEEKENEYVQ